MSTVLSDAGFGKFWSLAIGPHLRYMMQPKLAERMVWIVMSDWARVCCACRRKTDEPVRQTLETDTPFMHLNGPVQRHQAALASQMEVMPELQFTFVELHLCPYEWGLPQPKQPKLIVETPQTVNFIVSDARMNV